MNIFIGILMICCCIYVAIEFSKKCAEVRSYEAYLAEADISL